MMYCEQNEQNRQQITGLLKPRTAPVRICIVGGGFGGLYTALALGRFRLNSPCQITLVEPKERFLFTPLLYELVTGELQPWEIAPSYQHLLAESQTQLCQGTVQTIDLSARRVFLQDGSGLDYDYLVLAVGGETRLGNIPGAESYAYPFRSLEDAEHLQERLRFLESSDRFQIQIAIAGAGPSGVELACKLADRLGERGQVRLIERGDRILKSFNPAVQRAAQRALQKRRVEISLETDITQIGSAALTLHREGQVYPVAADLVLWTGGTGMLDWVRELPCPHNDQGQLLTLPTLQLTSHPEVFALGDLAAMDRPHGQVPATAQVAFQQADCAAHNLGAAIAGRPLLVFRYLHLGDMLTLGTQAAVVSSFGMTLEGKLAQVIRQGVYLQRLPTLRHRLRVLGHWINRAIATWVPRSWRRWGRRVRRGKIRRRQKSRGLG